MNVPDEHNYIKLVPRVIAFARANQLSNNAVVLYLSIMDRQNKNYWRPACIPERTLCYAAGVSHNTFIKLRLELFNHQLISVHGDGVNAPTYEIFLPPFIDHTANRATPDYIKHILYINSDVARKRLSEHEARQLEIKLAAQATQLEDRERELMERERKLLNDERAKEEANAEIFYARYLEMKNKSS
ncbi:MAG: hypothetical protein WCV63_00070 [Negativicutes bacterium]|jgi:hypothetical protein